MNAGFAFPGDFIYGWIAGGVLVLVAFAMGLRALERRRGVRIENFVELHLAPRLLLGHDAKLRNPLFWFVMIGFVSLALTFAQPHWGRTWQQVHQRSHDIVVCLDTSESMRAENPLPNRLERAKQKIASILDRASGDRFGLIAFSGAAELVCPLTLDRGYFKAVLNTIDTDTVSLEGTDIAAALEEAVSTFRDQEEQTGDYSRDSRAILLISDGEEVSGDALAAAKEAARYARIFVIGVGDPQGAKITYTNSLGGKLTLMDGAVPHLSKLDEETLQRVAIEGRGGYIRSRADNHDVEEIYNLIESLSVRDVSSDVRLQLVNRYQWPLSLAIFCFAAEGAWLVLLPWIRRWRMQRMAAQEGEADYA